MTPDRHALLPFEAVHDLRTACTTGALGGALGNYAQVHFDPGLSLLSLLEVEPTLVANCSAGG